MELHTIRSRLERGKLNKARRGELIINAPSGYVRQQAAPWRWTPTTRSLPILCPKALPYPAW